ncbi:MAG: long-chain acyl-CoA synthetase [Verrucomicrobiota bacterium]
MLAAWQTTLRDYGTEPAIFNTQGNVLQTFRQIDEQAADFAGKIDFLQPGEVIGIQIGNHPDWPSILLACLQRHLVVLPLDQSIRQQECQAALNICRGAALIQSGIATGEKYTITPLRPSGPGYEWAGPPPTLLKLTSGTTAAPRAIRFRSEQLVADCNQICRTMGITCADLNFGVIPISHSYGFSNLLTPLIVRAVPLVLSSDRVPRAVLTDLNRTNATVFPGMPVFYQAFCEINDIPLPQRLRLCISAGAPLAAATAIQFRKKFRLSIHSFYGASECGGICYDRGAESSEDGFVGEPLDGVALELVEPGAKSTQVRVRSRAVADTYFPDAVEAKLGGGVFIPDDLLTPSGGGYRIVGRISDVINVAGKKVNPAEVEAELLGLSGIKQAIVFGRKSRIRNEEVAACVVTSSAVSEPDILKACRSRLSGWQVPKRIFIVEEMPVNERGKISRRELAVRFADL